MVDIRVCAVVYGIIYDYVSVIKCVSIYQKNTVTNIAVTPLLNVWRQKKAKAVITYTAWYTHFHVRGWKLLYFTTCQPPNIPIYTDSLINMMNYFIKSIFKDKSSTVLKWAFSLCLAVSTCLHCDLWQKVTLFQNFINLQ